jgi:hypothetical protein
MDYCEYIRSDEYCALLPSFQEVESDDYFSQQQVLLFQQLAAHIPYGVAYDIALAEMDNAWYALNAQEIMTAESIYNRIMEIDQ